MAHNCVVLSTQEKRLALTKKEAATLVALGEQVVAVKRAIFRCEHLSRCECRDRSDGRLLKAHAAAAPLLAWLAAESGA